MKNLFLSITLALACWSNTMIAEIHEHEYVPLLEDGREWIYEFAGSALNVRCEDVDYENADFTFYSDYYALYLDGDTLIAGQTYMKCYYKAVCSKHFGELASEKYPVAYLREDGKKVYLIHNKRNYRSLGQLGPHNYECIKLDAPNLDGIYLIYDFEHMPECYGYDESCWSISDEVINGVWRTVYSLGEVIIEGIGPDLEGDLLSAFNDLPDCYPSNGPIGLVMMKEKDGTIVHKGRRYTSYLESRLPGDVNGDGKVNVSDITALINIILGVK